MSKHAPDQIFSATAPKMRRRSYAAIVPSVVWVVFVALCYLVLPRDLPAIGQRLLGLVCAALAVWAFLMITRRRESQEEMLYRLRRMQHSDFGKQLVQKQLKPRTIKLPGLGEVSLRAIGGVGVFVLVGLWWLTPLAPISVREATIGDLTAPLGEEIAAAALVMPNAHLAVPQPPAPPQRLRKAARLIRDDADPFQRALKAIVEGRFADAPPLLVAADRANVVEPAKVALVRAQNAVFAGHFVEAGQWYETAVAKSDDPLVACQAAVAWLHAGDFRRAEQYTAKAAKLCKDKDPAQAAVMHIQALMDVAAGKDFQRAQQRCYDLRELLPEDKRDSSPFAAASYNNQAVLYVLRGNYQGAEELFGKAHDLWVAHSGKDHPLAAAGLGNLGILDYILGRYARAEQRLEQAADIRNEGLAAQPLGRAVGLSALGVIHVAKCEYDEARKFLEQARALADQELAEKGQSAEHRSVVAVVDTLGVLCLAQARYQQADAHLMRALTVAKRVWGEQHPYAAGILNDIAELRLCQTRYDEAIETAGKAAELYKRAFPDLGENHVGAAAAKAICGRAEIGRGRAPEARKLLAPVLDVQQRSFGREHPAIARTMGDLASLDSSTNTYDRGVGQFGRAIKMAEGILGREHPEVAHLLFGLAALHIARDKFAAAEPLLKEAAAIQEKTLVANHPDLAATLELHAEALRRQSPPQTEQAAALAARAQAIRQKHAAADRPE